MPKTTIEGGCVVHKTISDECRKTHGDYPAIQIAMIAAVDALADLMETTTRGKGFKFHVVVTCERPIPETGAGT